MIIKKNSQKFREVKREVVKLAEEMVPEDVDLRETDYNPELPEEDDDEDVYQPQENLPKEPEIDLFDIEILYHVLRKKLIRLKNLLLKRVTEKGLSRQKLIYKRLETIFLLL